MSISASLLGKILIYNAITMWSPCNN